MNIEEYNYWNDPRIRAGMINKGKKEETKDGRIYLVIEDLRLLCRFEVCGTCDGRGKHVNPSIDCCGLTAADFDEDPGFLDEYMSGMYDVSCNECGGLRVVPVPDREHNTAEDIQAYDDHIRREHEYAAEVAAERKMGA